MTSQDLSEIGNDAQIHFTNYDYKRIVTRKYIYAHYYKEIMLKRNDVNRG